MAGSHLLGINMTFHDTPTVALCYMDEIFHAVLS